MHKIEHKVIYADTDAGQVVYYGNYFRWFESGRTELLKELGISYSSVEKKGMIAPVVEAHCNYFKPSKYDDTIVIETRISQIGDKSIRFDHQVFRKKDKKLLATGHTINVFVDRKTMKSIRIPAYLRARLKIG